MGFNYGLEKKNFDRQWAIMRKQYEDAGMSMWQMSRRSVSATVSSS